MATLRIRDDLGRDLLFGAPPRRIVSLVPSDTYTLMRLGCADRLIGRTRYCPIPDVPGTVEELGGTKDVDVERVLSLAPDLVVANQEENTRGALERMAGRVPLLVSLPRRVADGIAHVARLVRILRLERDATASALVRAGYAALEARPQLHDPLPVFIPIWMDPLMTLNGDTFGSDIASIAGGANVFADRLRLYPLAADLGKAAAQDPGERDVRYPRVTLEEVRTRRPRAIVLPDEPHAFSSDDVSTFSGALPGVPTAHVSGKDLFWYGAWSIEAVPRLSAFFDQLRTQLRD